MGPTGRRGGAAPPPLPPRARGPTRARRARGRAPRRGRAAPPPIRAARASPEEVERVGGRAAPRVADTGRGAGRPAPLFAELATLEKPAPRRERLREILVEEHLPLVRHFARRFSNRG